MVELFVEGFTCAYFIPSNIVCDNRSAQLLAANLCFQDKSKHFSVDFHFTRDKVQDGFLKTAHISSQSQIADIFTKSLLPKSHPSFPPSLVSFSLRGAVEIKDVNHVLAIQLQRK